MKYKVGDKVKIKSLDWYNENKDKYENVPMGQFSFNSCNKHLCGAILTIKRRFHDCYLVEENEAYWTDEMIEGLVEEENNDCEKCGLTRNSTRCLFMDNCPHNKQKNIIEIPKDWVLKDENGNVINATKIVLEKKKKEVILTQEQIDTMVHESCVLFCKHCGCGVPRETCTSLDSCKDHDEYRKSMRTYFEKHKK